MSAGGTKRKWRPPRWQAAYGSKADSGKVSHGCVLGRDNAEPDRVSGVSVNIIGKNGELITAELYQEIAWPGSRPQALGDYLRNAITECLASFNVTRVSLVYRQLLSSWADSVRMHIDKVYHQRMAGVSSAEDYELQGTGRRLGLGRRKFQANPRNEASTRPAADTAKVSTMRNRRRAKQA